MLNVYFYGIKMFLVKLFQQKIIVLPIKRGLQGNNQVNTTNVFKNNVRSQHVALQKGCQYFLLDTCPALKAFILSALG